MYSRQTIMDTMRAIKAEADTVKPYFFLAQPRRNATDMPVQRVENFHGLHIDVMGYSHNVGVICGESVDVARNYLCEEALRSGAKYMVFIGDDVAFPYDGILKLHETAEKNPRACICGVYYQKISSPLIMVFRDGWVTPAQDTTPQAGLIDTYTTGLDCALIPISLLAEMKKEQPDNCFCACAMGIPEIGKNYLVGEDCFFWHRAKKLGWKILTDTRVQCLHCDVPTGKYTAWEGVNLKDYITNCVLTTPLQKSDKEYLDKRWLRPLAPPPKVAAKPGPKGPESDEGRDRRARLAALEEELQ